MKINLVALALLVAMSAEAEMVKPSIVQTAEDAILNPKLPKVALSQKVTIELVALAPSNAGPMAMFAVDKGKDTKVLPVGDSWRGLSVNAIDLKAQTATVAVKGEISTLRLYGANQVRVACDWDCPEEPTDGR